MRFGLFIRHRYIKAFWSRSYDQQGIIKSAVFLFRPVLFIRMPTILKTRGLK